MGRSAEHWSEDQRAALAEEMRKRWEDPAFRAAQRPKKLPIEVSCSDRKAYNAAYYRLHRQLKRGPRQTEAGD